MDNDVTNWLLAEAVLTLVPLIVGGAVSLLMIVLGNVWCGYYTWRGSAFGRLYREVGLDELTGWIPLMHHWRLLQLCGRPGWLAILGCIGLGVVPWLAVWTGQRRLLIAFDAPRTVAIWAVLFPPVWASKLAAPGRTYRPERLVATGYAVPQFGTRQRSGAIS